MRKRAVSLLIVAVMVAALAVPAYAAYGLENFTTVNEYTEGKFQDVPEGAWYAPYVKRGYELGLLNGKTETTFDPEGNISLAESIAIACRIMEIYRGGTGVFSQGESWYQVYVDYGKENDIIDRSGYPDYGRPATRAEFAEIMYRSIPSFSRSFEFDAINDVKDIPDVPKDADCADTVYKLYNAGVLAGSDEYGTFYPDNTITRGEAAAIITRLVQESERKTFKLKTNKVMMFAPGDRTLFVKPESVELYESVGWSLTEPVSTPRDTPLRIYGDPVISVNSVDGVSIYIKWNSHRDKTIKYINFYVTPYNRVGDVVSSEIGDKTTVDCYATGPFNKVSANTDWSADQYYMLTSEEDYFTKEISRTLHEITDGTYLAPLYYEEPGDTHGCRRAVASGRYDDVFYSHYWECVWYNGDISRVSISRVEIEYMDGTSETVQGGALANCIY